MAFKDRLRQARKAKRMTQSELGALIGVQKTTVSGYESGNSYPDVLKIQSIINALGIDANYLWQDEMSEPFPFPWNKPLDDAYEAAETPRREVVCDVLKIPYVDPSKRPDPDADVDSNVEADEEEMVDVATQDLPSAAGAGSWIDDRCESIPFPASVVPPKTDCGIRIKGHSMEPDIHNGDIVFVRKSEEIYNHQVGIFIINGDEGVCKRAKFDENGRLVRLMSDNPRVPDISVKDLDDFRIFGRVLGVYHNLDGK